MPLRGRLLMALVQCCGPVAWWHPFRGAMELLCAFGIVWAAWLLIVAFTRLRRLPLGVHLLLGFLWCGSGCPIAGLVVT
jgi:hypothetical protein